MYAVLVVNGSTIASGWHWFPPGDEIEPDHLVEVEVTASGLKPEIVWCIQPDLSTEVGRQLIKGEGHHATFATVGQIVDLTPPIA